MVVVPSVATTVAVIDVEPESDRLMIPPMRRIAGEFGSAGVINLAGDRHQAAPELACLGAGRQANNDRRDGERLPFHRETPSELDGEGPLLEAPVGKPGMRGNMNHMDSRVGYRGGCAVRFR